ncbi:MAG: phage tail assembly protein [Lachnospiraceae bacterium]|nr:phage tail assembly protein [Lachnospiraceae bacterium]
MEFQTEYFFTLPKGFVDRDGNVHRDGIMRMANARDEILPLCDPRVKQNPSYMAVILLSRVVTCLGNIAEIDTKIIEGLYTIDMVYLLSLYQKINTMVKPVYKGICPHCGEALEIPIDLVDVSD